MKIPARALLALLLPCLLIAAKSEGCSAEVAGNDTSNGWETADVPEQVGPDRPMTCEWLESDNCWKSVAQAARDCAPAARGKFNDARDTCTFETGEVLEWETGVSKPASGVTHLPVIEHRLLDAEGNACFTAKIIAPFKSAYSAGGKTVVMESKDVLSYRVICPDGSAYASNVEGSCPSLGAKWLANEIPGYLLTCNGTDQVCTAKLQGAGTRGVPETLMTCGE